MAGAFLMSLCSSSGVLTRCVLTRCMLGSGRLDPKYVRILTAFLILYVAVRLAIRFYSETMGASG